MEIYVIINCWRRHEERRSLQIFSLAGEEQLHTMRVGTWWEARLALPLASSLFIYAYMEQILLDRLPSSRDRERELACHSYLSCQLYHLSHHQSSYDLLFLYIIWSIIQVVGWNNVTRCSYLLLQLVNYWGDSRGSFSCIVDHQYFYLLISALPGRSPPLSFRCCSFDPRTMGIGRDLKSPSIPLISRTTEQSLLVC